MEGKSKHSGMGGKRAWQTLPDCQTVLNLEMGWKLLTISRQGIRALVPIYKPGFFIVLYQKAGGNIPTHSGTGG